MQTIKRGINVSGFGDWAENNPLFKDEYFKIIKTAGFDHVRLPFYFGSRHGINVSDEYFAVVRKVVAMARKYGMVAIVDMHGFVNMDEQPMKYRDDFIAAWRVIAEKLQDMDENVWFEIINEPHENFGAALLNDFQNAAIAEIRKTNPDRMIVAACAHYNTAENLKFLQLPQDENIIVTLHNYTPMSVTHQGAEWCSDKYPTGVKWYGTDSEIEQLRKTFDLAAEWSKENNCKLWLGEFGVYDKGDLESRVRWTEIVVKMCEERDIAWAYWEFGCGFGAYDIQKGCWKEPLINALLPGPVEVGA